MNTFVIGAVSMLVLVTVANRIKIPVLSAIVKLIIGA